MSDETRGRFTRMDELVEQATKIQKECRIQKLGGRKVQSFQFKISEYNQFQDRCAVICKAMPPTKEVREAYEDKNYDGVYQKDLDLRIISVVEQGIDMINGLCEEFGDPKAPIGYEYVLRMAPTGWWFLIRVALFPKEYLDKEMKVLTDNTEEEYKVSNTFPNPK